MLRSAIALQEPPYNQTFAMGVTPTSFAGRSAAGPKAGYELTFNSDHSIGAGHEDAPSTFKPPQSLSGR